MACVPVNPMLHQVFTWPNTTLFRWNPLKGNITSLSFWWQGISPSLASNSASHHNSLPDGIHYGDPVIEEKRLRGLCTQVSLKQTLPFTTLSLQMKNFSVKKRIVEWHTCSIVKLLPSNLLTLFKKTILWDSILKWHQQAVKSEAKRSVR
jgi:hypothetical protein